MTDKQAGRADFLDMLDDHLASSAAETPNEPANQLEGGDQLESEQAGSAARPSAAPAPTPTPTPSQGLGAIVSMTLSNIAPDRRPNPSTVCEVCPASVWMATPAEVKCYCRLMHLVTWRTKEQETEMTHCDGLALAEEQQAAAE